MRYLLAQGYRVIPVRPAGLRRGARRRRASQSVAGDRGAGRSSSTCSDAPEFDAGAREDAVAVGRGSALAPARHPLSRVAGNRRGRRPGLRRRPLHRGRARRSSRTLRASDRNADAKLRSGGGRFIRPQPKRPTGEEGGGSRGNHGFPRAVIGVPRFELGTSPTRTERATRLRHTPSAETGYRFRARRSAPRPKIRADGRAATRSSPYADELLEVHRFPEFGPPGPAGGRRGGGDEDRVRRLVRRSSSSSGRPRPVRSS